MAAALHLQWLDDARDLIACARIAASGEAQWEGVQPVVTTLLVALEKIDAVREVLDATSGAG